MLPHIRSYRSLSVRVTRVAYCRGIRVDIAVTMTPYENIQVCSMYIISNRYRAYAPRIIAKGICSQNALNRNISFPNNMDWKE